MNHEQRAAQRYPFRRPVRLRQGEGWTRDMSTGGLYFVTSAPLQTGASLKLLVLPLGSNETGAEIYCAGQVVRAEANQDGFGVAMRVASFWFGLPEAGRTRRLGCNPDP